MKLTILLVEQNMKVVMGICEMIQVIDYGEENRHRPPAEIQKNPKSSGPILAAADDVCCRSRM